jgi:hypothetical protein
MTPFSTRPGARIGLLLTAFVLLGGSPACRAAGSADGELLTPPLPGGKPVAVAISIHIINLASIDEVKQQFEIDGYLMLHWIDPRLAFTPTGMADLRREYDRTAVWIPHVEMVNAVAPRERYDTSTEGDSEGAVNYVERFHTVLSSKFMLRRFPFDSQSLLIIVHPYLRQERLVEFTAYNPDVWATQSSPNTARLRNGTCKAWYHRLAVRACIPVCRFQKRALPSRSSAATLSTSGRCFCRCC